MSALIHEEALAERANLLEGLGFNGLELVIVHLEPDGAPVRALLDVYFHNPLHVADLLADGGDPRTLFPMRGGRRRLAGDEPGQVQVTAIAAGAEERALRLTVEPIGDYSTYRLAVQFPDIDPVFAELPFKFRPGCFTAECTPRDRGGPRPVDDPGIDYTAKDYASFRHTLIAAMSRRMPGWTPTSEADLSQTLIDYLAAAADELSDYQDRVVNERGLTTARNRVSLARHARLMDYHVHQGNQASTWLALEVDDADLDLPDGLVASTSDGAQRFERRAACRFTSLLNGVELYTWSDARPGLDVGATSAELALGAGAEAVADLIADGVVTELLIWEALDPATGSASGRDPSKRQILRLVPPAEFDTDLVTGETFLRVSWRREDALRAAYCATVFLPDGGEITGVTLFSGNLVQVDHGRRREVTFLPPGEPRGAGERSWRRSRWGALCHLTGPEPLLYRDTVPGSEDPPMSTVELEVITPAGTDTAWEERISLVHARPEDRRFAVETDELGRSLIRFGNGDNGAELPDGASVRVSWQAGEPLAGNVGAETIVRCEPAVRRCWNPFDVTGARAPESREQIVRRAPEAYRARQLRWVSLADVVARAEEIEGVARAAARYAWTGSWTAVQLVIDPVGSEVLDDDLRRRVADHMAPLALIGDDLEIRAPRFVPLHITVDVCLHADHWPEHVRAAIEDELSDGFTADGRPGLFHPDQWTFGQSLHASQVLGRIQAVAGVAHVVAVDLQRYREPTPGPGDRIEVQLHEIIQVHNDPDDMERGVIEILPLRGGRG